jgi:hypothetical protein
MSSVILSNKRNGHTIRLGCLAWWRRLPLVASSTAEGSCRTLYGVRSGYTLSRGR